MSNVIPMQMYIKNDTLFKEFAIDERKSREDISKYLKEVLGTNFQEFIYRKGQKVSTGKYNARDITYYLRVANITFMGGKEGQHPLDLKRIQYDLHWREFYDEFNSKGKVIWLGLYTFKETKVWAFFEPESYLRKHKGTSMLTSKGLISKYSCHIYLNDLFKGAETNVFEKIDKNKNKIVSINYNYLKQYLDGQTFKMNPIIEIINQINESVIKWKNWISAKDAIPYMKELKNKNSFTHWKQNLWNGYFVEAKYSEYLYDNPSDYIEYIGTSKNQAVLNEYKTKGLDLAFQHPAFHFIGDLKAMCEGYGSTLLNDEKKVKEALKEYKKIWFIIYFHNKNPGKTANYEMVEWRNKYIIDVGEWKKDKKFDIRDAPHTPHSIQFTEMVIVELNEITKEKYFHIGKQWGPNSNGKERNDKYKINKKMLKSINDDSLVIYRYYPK